MRILTLTAALALFYAGSVAVAHCGTGGSWERPPEPITRTRTR